MRHIAQYVQPPRPGHVDTLGHGRIEFMTGPSSSPPEQAPPPPRAAMGPRVAAVLAFTSSAAVLVVEITALRLLAPYLGLTLETSTLVIGIALAAIALGSWAGGSIAD